MSLAQPFLYFAGPTPNGNHRNLPCLQGQLEMPSNKHLQPISTLPTTRPQEHLVVKYSDFFAHWWSTLRCVFHTLSWVPKEPTPVFCSGNLLVNTSFIFLILSPISALLHSTTVFWYFLSKKLLVLESLSQNLVLGEPE